jgi:hypothetical protein
MTRDELLIEVGRLQAEVDRLKSENRSVVARCKKLEDALCIALQECLKQRPCSSPKEDLWTRLGNFMF